MHAKMTARDIALECVEAAMDEYVLCRTRGEPMIRTVDEHSRWIECGSLGSPRGFRRLFVEGFDDRHWIEVSGLEAA